MAKESPSGSQILEDTSAICERHFEPGCVVRHCVHTVNGEEIRTERGKPALRSDAVPAILPNSPAYLTKKKKKTVHERAPRKRKAENSGTPAKHMLRSGREVDVSAPATDTDAAAAAGCRARIGGMVFVLNLLCTCVACK